MIELVKRVGARVKEDTTLAEGDLLIGKYTGNKVDGSIYVVERAANAPTRAGRRALIVRQILDKYGNEPRWGHHGYYPASLFCLYEEGAKKL